jgi:hypothetical protein
VAAAPRSREPTRNPQAGENCEPQAELVQVKKRLQQAGIIIDVHQEASALLEIALPEVGRKEGHS